MKRFGLCDDVRTMTLDFVSLMPGGGGLWHWTQSVSDGLAERVARQLEASGNPLQRISTRLTRARCEAYFRRRISQEIYYMVAMCLVAEREDPTAERLALVRMGDLAPVLEEAGVKWLKNTRFQPVPSLKGLVIVRWFRLLWNHIKLVRFRSGGVRSTLKSSVAIQGFWGADTGEVGPRGDLWWYRASRLSPDRAVVFFCSPKRPATDGPLDKLEELGYRCRILTRDSNQSRRKTARYHFSCRKTLLRDLRNAFSLWVWAWHAPAGRWRFTQWLVVATSVRRWQAFMEEEAIRVIFDVSESSSETLSLACDVTDAIKLGMHWGDYPVPYARITPMQQVQFIWGSRYTDVLEAMGSPAEVIVEAGNIFDHADYREQWMTAAQAHRTRLKAAGVKRVVGIIDRSLGDLSIYPPPYHVAFYEKILDWVERDPSLGLIIKAKASEGPAVAALFPEIELRIEKMAQEGRVQILTGEKYVGEAAAGSDLVMALGLNSGGLLCALEEVPTVFWDPAQSRNAPTGAWVDRFGWSARDVVFDDMDQVISRAGQFLKEPTADPQFGDFKDAIVDVDEFRDGRTGERIADFVDSFVGFIDMGRSRSEALEAAVLDYNDHWGGGRAKMMGNQERQH